MNYTAYHVHSELSSGTTNIDSITNFRDYVALAKSYGMKALGISEHGNTFEWLHKKEAIEEAGMKYLHCVEAYITGDNNENSVVYTATNILDTAIITTKLAPFTRWDKTVKVRFKEHWVVKDEEDNDIHLVRTLDDISGVEKGATVWIDPLTITKEYEKTRDNYHCILIAKNYDGVKELNRLVSNSFNRNDCHFYYAPRITFDELFTTSDNIIITSACLGGVLNSENSSDKERFLTFLVANKHRCYLEIQHHNCEEQIEYNRFLYELSQNTGLKLIAGTDTHALNDDHLDGRSMLQKAKRVRFGNEDEWDLSFKSYDELVKAFEIQNSLPRPVYLAAINETNLMADSVEEFTLDYSPKYPKLYDNSEEVFKQKINEGVKSRGINNYPNYEVYKERIRNEYEVYKHNGAIDFMLLEENYKSEMRKKNIKYGYSRGSVSGSIIAYLLYITEIDSVKYNLNFERFMSKERVSLADIDSDWLSEDRKAVKDYLHSKDGLYCCDIVTFNTIALRGAIDDISRAFFYDNLDHLPNEVKEEIAKIDKENTKNQKNNGAGSVVEEKSYPTSLVKKIEKYSIHKEVPYDYMSFASMIKSYIVPHPDNPKKEIVREDIREKYPEFFKYVDMVKGVVVSVGNHPAGCVVSPFPVNEWFGTFTTASDEYPISVLNMKEIDALNFVKLDILGLDNIGLIYKTCDAAGIPFATPDNIPADDMDVWDSIVDDTTLIFQWESSTATAYLKQLMSKDTIARIKDKNPNVSYMDLLSIGNGAIRPAGDSYRDDLSKGNYRDNGHEALNKFLEPTLGFLVYQEEVMEFLHLFCGYTMGEADVVRRGFAKKTGTEKFVPQIKSGFIKTMQEKYGVSQKESEKLIVSFLKVIEDASDYLFSKNHSDPYSWIGYICGYLRYYYPLEFITTALNIFEGKEEKSLAIIEYAKKRNIPISPIKFRYSIAKYSYDKDSFKIFKGISSIKFMNETIANELYVLRDNQYDSFVDLLYDIDKKTSVNARQLNILIGLDFFEEFGDANYLLAIVNLFKKIGKRVQINKNDIEKLGLKENIIRKFAGNETEKTFTQIDARGLLNNTVQLLKVPKRTLREKIMAQIEHLGYIDVVDKKYSKILAVLSIDTKYSPRIQMYSLKTGNSLEFKINKKTFKKNPLKKGDIILVQGHKVEPKKKMVDGKFVSIPGTSERWITQYKKVEKI